VVHHPVLNKPQMYFYTEFRGTSGFRAQSTIVNVVLHAYIYATNTLKQILSWDRCYDFLNTFAENFGENVGVFGSNYS
jgi:hypothetical protein